MSTRHAIALSLALLAAPAAAEPLVRAVDHALMVRIPEQGLARLGDAVEIVIPDAFPVAAASGAFDCSDSTALTYTLSGFDLRLSTDDVLIETATDRLDATIFATLDSAPASLAVAGDCSVLEDLDEVCGLQIPVTALEIGLSVALGTTPEGLVDATVAPVELFVSPIANPLSDCLLASAVGTALGQNPSLIDDLVEQALVPALEDIPATVEEALESALNSFAADTSIDLLGTPLALRLDAERVEVSADGLIVGLSATLGAEVGGSCVDPAGIPPERTSWPVLGETAPGTSLRPDAAVLVGRGFVQDLLTASWATGLFCQEIEEFSGARLNGAAVDAFFGGAVTELVDPEARALVRLRSDAPPRVHFSEDQPVVGIALDALALDLIVEHDHRLVRLAEIGIDAEAGLDLSIVDRTLAPTLSLEAEAFRFEERWSELLPPGYSAGLGNLLGIVLDGLLPSDALAEIRVPTPLGIELEEPFWIPTPDGEWQGLYLRLDLSEVRPLELPGCSVDALGCGEGGGGGFELDLDAALGCDDPNATGCEDGGSCSTIVVPARPVLALLLLGPFTWARRRRRRQAPTPRA